MIQGKLSELEARIATTNQHINDNQPLPMNESQQEYRNLLFKVQESIAIQQQELVKWVECQHTEVTRA